MATKPISLRVAESVKLELEQIARRFGTSPATLGADYVTQGVRTTSHPSIEFRQTPAGRMAYVRGVRLPVWLAVVTVEDCHGNAAQAAKLLHLPPLLLQAALNYAKAFPHDTAADREACGSAARRFGQGGAESFFPARVKHRLLLDSHVPVAVAGALRKLRPGVDVHHVSTWLEGAYSNASDDLLLEACWKDRRALVSKDRATLPEWIALRVAEGKEHGGVLFYDLERFKAHQIGALAKAIATALDQPGGKLANRWITLR